MCCLSHFTLGIRILILATIMALELPTLNLFRIHVVFQLILEIVLVPPCPTLRVSLEYSATLARNVCKMLLAYNPCI